MLVRLELHLDLTNPELRSTRGKLEDLLAEKDNPDYGAINRVLTLVGELISKEKTFNIEVKDKTGKMIAYVVPVEKAEPYVQ